MTVSFREFKLEDLVPVARMAEDIWIRPEYGPRHSFEISYLYVYHAMEKQTSTIVMEDDGEVVGVVSVRDRTKHAKPAVKKKDIMTYARDMLQMDEAEELIQLEKIYEKINRKMIKECRLQRTDEVLLLMVDFRMRGLGFGKKLFQEGLKQLSGKRGRRVFILTDDASNYRFYEKIGCEQVDHKTMDWAGKPMKMFVYALDY